MKSTRALFERRKRRTRWHIRQVAGSRARFSVFRSNKHIYAQVIDDLRGHTIAAASSLDADLRRDLKSGADRTAASRVGSLIAQRATAAGVREVTFDRGGYLYHGRVRALAEAAREGGMSF